MIPLCTLLATTDSPPFLLDLSLIYLWYLKGGRLSLFIYLFIYLFIEKQQNVKQNFEVHLTDDRKGWKTDLLSLHPSLLERIAGQAIVQNF